MFYVQLVKDETDWKRYGARYTVSGWRRKIPTPLRYPCLIVKKTGDVIYKEDVKAFMKLFKIAQVPTVAVKAPKKKTAKSKIQ